MLVLRHLLSCYLVQGVVILVDILQLLVVDLVGLFLLFLDLGVFAFGVLVEVFLLLAPGQRVVVLLHFSPWLIHELIFARHA